MKGLTFKLNEEKLDDSILFENFDWKFDFVKAADYVISKTDRIVNRNNEGYYTSDYYHYDFVLIGFNAQNRKTNVLIVPQLIFLEDLKNEVSV